MDQRAAYLLQILETIGSPLMSAITEAAPAQDPANPQADAQSMAALLAKTVEASIELGEIMQINPAEAQDDTLRVALAGLAGPLVAGQFSKRAQIPEGPDLKKITSALQAVLTFSDNFTPTPETVERLKNLEASGQVVDTYQTQIQYMQAFIPVIEAISAFPFGQAEAKLIMDVSDRLVKKSVELRETLLPGVADEAAQKRAELGLLRALARLYSACHRAETEKVLNLDENEREGGLSMDPVWTAFGLRAAMLEALAVKMVPGGSVTGGKAPAAPTTSPPAAEQPLPAPVTEAPQQTAPVQNPAPQEAPPAAPPAAPPETPPPAAPPAQDQNAQGVNPMSMFAAPKTDTAQTPPAPATPPPVTETPQTEAPPPVTPEQPPAAPPATPPETPQDSGQDEGEGGDQNTGQGQSGNPMSFFKKGDE